MIDHERSAVYGMIADLLLHPNERQTAEVLAKEYCASITHDEVRKAMQTFVEDATSWSGDEYVRVLELAPPCPLYLGTYLFDEPTTCRGVGTSGRNAYMLELGGVYRHFGFQITGGELRDYLPAVVEFCRISLHKREVDGIGLRRRLLEKFVLPALKPMEESLTKFKSSYANIIAALAHTVLDDLENTETGEPWMPPVVTAETEHEVQLAVLSSQDGGRRITPVMTGEEKRS